MININQLVASTVKHAPVPYMPANLTLIFSVGTGGFVEDAVGNPIEMTTDVVIRASVHSDTPKPHEMDGQIGTNTILLTGRIVEPKTLPPAIDLDQSAQALLVDSVSGQEIEGTFRFFPVAQNRFPAFTEHMGMKIRGYLVVAGRV